MKKDKKIFSVDFNMTIDEYKRLVKYVPSFYWGNVFKSSFFIVLFIMILSVINDNGIVYSLVVCFVLIIGVMIISKVKIEFLAEVNYKFHNRKGLFNKSVQMSFYDKYFISSSNGVDVKVEYDSIDKIIETETNFYIFFKNMISIVKKSDNVDIEFIRNINEKVFISDVSNKMSLLEKEKFSKLLSFLMVGSILSFVGAIFTIRTIAKRIPEFLITEKMFVFWLWLPIPIITIVFGYICKRRRIDSGNSIKIGWIVSILLIFFGSFSVVMPVGRVQYKDVKKYEEVLNVKLPNDGDFVQNKYETYFDLDKKNVVVTEMYFSNKTSAKKLGEELVESDNWIRLSLSIDDFDNLIPYQMKNIECKKCYVTIYNDESKEYNKYPDKNGKYNFIVGLYNLDSNVLEINTFEMEV